MSSEYRPLEVEATLLSSRFTRSFDLTGRKNPPAQILCSVPGSERALALLYQGPSASQDSIGCPVDKLTSFYPPQGNGRILE